MRQKRIGKCPRDLYDALEFSALAFGGVGGGQRWEMDDLGKHAPYCIVGHALAIAGLHPYTTNGMEGSMAIAELLRHGIGWMENDAAVAAINMRRKRAMTARVSFAEWCAELGVVRGV